ncbi:hypothetical protein H0486_00850 [Lachnospiraceae bacterium MD1]|uniref:Uncharacterized protein n=1 Tax=Variimorphobacter saccharofermentans TaxID=2755051 RepID=A0A839JW04_9FIRM|nr:hypothetical protein [Variimorphobacter saccharofermentans]MBB2181444.1 hypothetical protein [Variimorphobacter saccharofermentans]
MEQYELRKIIGIDALKLVSFRIIIVNEEILHEAERKKFIEVEYASKASEIIGIRIVKDSLFKSLRWEKKKTSDKTYEVSSLELTVSADNNNLNPLLVDEINARLSSINLHLLNDLGIEIRTDGFVVNEIEANINIPMPKKFEDLLPLYRKLLANIPYFNRSYKESGKLIKLRDKDMDSSPTAYECCNQGKTVKGSIICYDKGEDLRRKKCMDLHDNILRIELKASKNRTVKKLYGTTSWNEFTNERVYQAYFNNIISQIHLYLNSVYSPYCLKLGGKLIKKHKSKKNTWLVNLIKEIEQLNKRDIPLILDWQDLLPAFRAFDTYRHLSRVKGALERAATNTSIGHAYRICLDLLLHEMDDIYNNGIVNTKITIIK